MPKGNPAIPTCGHPEERVKGQGQCERCYDREYYSRPGKAEAARARTAKWRRENLERVRRTDFAKHVRRKYGISIEQYDRFVAAQANRCAICGSRQSRGFERLCVDHCHDTGQIRGLLCHRCNTGIGLFVSDYSLLEAAAHYLDRHTRRGKSAAA